MLSIGHRLGVRGVCSAPPILLRGLYQGDGDDSGGVRQP